MSVLADEVKARYGDQYLVNLTNPYATAPAAINSGRLEKAVDDVVADFENEIGLTFDETDPTHISPAVEGVIAKLIVRTGIAGNDDGHADYLARLRALGDTTSRERLEPGTPSELVPTPDRGRPPKPAFDNAYFDDLIPGIPREGRRDKTRD